MLHQNDESVYSTKTRIFFILLGVVLLTYFVSLAGGFVFDDRYIWQYRDVLRIGNLLNVLQMPYWSVDAGLYRPITLASYAFNYSLFGESPFWFHLINLSLYAFTGYLLFRLVETLSNNRKLAFVAALIFVILPIHSEVAANIIGRAEILSLLFSLLLFIEVLKKSPSPVFLFLWSFMALGSKENAIAVVPIVVILLYVWKKRRDWEQLVWPILGCASYFALRILILGNNFTSVETSVVENPLMFAPVLPRIYTAFSVLSLYIEKTFVPISLCSNYSYNQIPVLYDLLNGKVLFGFSVFVASFVSIFFFLKKKPIIALACALFFFPFFVVSNLLVPIGTIAGERLMYFPSVGIAILLAYGICWLLDRTHYALAVKWFLFAIFVFYFYISFVNSINWLTEERLFANSVRCAPNSVMSHSNLGAAYYLNGDLAKAEIELVRANQIYGYYMKGVNNLGLIYWKTGRRDLAKQMFENATNHPYPYVGALENLALMSIEDGDTAKAKKYLVEFFSGNESAADQYIGSQCILNGQCQWTR